MRRLIPREYDVTGVKSSAEIGYMHEFCLTIRVDGDILKQLGMSDKGVCAYA